MKISKLIQVFCTLVFLSLLTGCFSGSGALIQEKDAELERLSTELDQLEKRLDTEKKISTELVIKQDELE